MASRVGGTIALLIDGRQYLEKGEFTYNLGAPKRTPVAGESSIHGYSEAPQIARIEGEITDEGDLDLRTLLDADGVTATLELANGKTVVLSDAWYAADGDGRTREGNIQILLHSVNAREV